MPNPKRRGRPPGCKSKLQVDELKLALDLIKPGTVARSIRYAACTQRLKSDNPTKWNKATERAIISECEHKMSQRSLNAFINQNQERSNALKLKQLLSLSKILCGGEIHEPWLTNGIWHINGHLVVPDWLGKLGYQDSVKKYVHWTATAALRSLCSGRPHRYAWLPDFINRSHIFFSYYSDVNTPLPSGNPLGNEPFWREFCDEMNAASPDDQGQFLRFVTLVNEAKLTDTDLWAFSLNTFVSAIRSLQPEYHGVFRSLGIINFSGSNVSAIEMAISPSDEIDIIDKEIAALKKLKKVILSHSKRH